MANTTTIDVWKQSFSEAQQTLSRFIEEPDIWKKLNEFSDRIAQTFEKEGTVLTCGNGGSHCDAMHFAEEWTGRYRKDRKPLGSLALGDASHTTCVSNDFGFEHIFERQVLGLGRPGDCLVVFSTSGNSKNQILAVEAARAKKMSVIGLLGRDGGKLKSMVDLAIVVPGQTSDRIQEIHIKLVHTVIETVERKLFPELYS
jgi:D-sedoheptulose 7-phosphate isomerase